MIDAQAVVTGEKDREISTARVINAPVEVVFGAWIDREQIVQWWGPRGFTNTFLEFEPFAGGAWKFIMHGPDGGDYNNESVFLEVDQPARVVVDHISPPKFQLTATFEDLGSKTKLTWRMLFETSDLRDKIKELAIDGNEQNLDRLESHLAGRLMK